MTRHYPMLLALLLVAGCGEPSAPVAAPPEASTVATASGPRMESRSWKGRCEGTARFTSPSTLEISGTCQFAHAGRLALLSRETINGFALSAENRYTSPNGDVLLTTSEGSYVPLPDFSGVTFSGIETVVGGTGRFSGAAGSATRIGRTAFGSPNVGSYELEGTLTLDHAP